MNIVKIARGLSKPRNSLAYKEAKIEVQRLSAPLLAVLLPAMTLAALIVATAVRPAADRVRVEIVMADDDSDFVPPDEEAPPPVDMTEPVDLSAENIDVVIEVDEPAASEPVAVEPLPPSRMAKSDSAISVQSISSPVKFKGLQAEQGGGGFGSVVSKGKGGGRALPKGALLGEIIDFKRDSKGNDRGVNVMSGDYWLRVRDLIEGGFRDSAYKEVYRLPMRVALTHLWIPPQPATNGPEAFGASQYMEPKYWVAHYSGMISSPRKMRCRFIGYFDDCMEVLVDGKVVLEVHWAMKGTDKGRVTGWKSPAPEECKWCCPQDGCMMIVGDWVDFEPGKEMRFDIVCGEQPGGKIGGLLCIEEQGRTYDRMPDGRPKWPIFASRPLAITDRITLENAAYGIGVDGPRFNTDGHQTAYVEKDDVAVAIDL